MQVSFKFGFISTVTNHENDKQNDGNYIMYICSFPRKAIVKSLEVAEIDRVHYLKHNRKTVRLTKTNFADYMYVFTFFTWTVASSFTTRSW